MNLIEVKFSAAHRTEIEEHGHVVLLYEKIFSSSRAFGGILYGILGFVRKSRLNLYQQNSISER